MIEKLTDIFYKLTSGQACDSKKTKCTIKHLIDNGFTAEEIYKVFNLVELEGDDLLPNNLPDSLWEESLVKRDTYYYHEILHIKSKAPKWDPVSMKEVIEPYFMEMKIRFTLDDLLEYFYTKCGSDISLRDYKKDIGAIKYLVDKYDNKLNGIESLDFVLRLIDMASDEDKELINPLDLQDYLVEAKTYFDNIKEQAALDGVNNIVWRTYI